MSDWCFVQDNLKPYFAVQLLKEKDDQPVDLSGGVTTFYFRQVDNADPKISGGTCYITDALNGKVEYRWQGTDLADPGEYVAEFRTSYGGDPHSVIIEGVMVQEKVG